MTERVDAGGRRSPRPRRAGASVSGRSRRASRPSVPKLSIVYAALASGLERFVVLKKDDFVGCHTLRVLTTDPEKERLRA